MNKSEKLRPPGPCKHGPNKEFQATDGIRCDQCAWDGYVWAVELLDEKEREIDKLKWTIERICEEIKKCPERAESISELYSNATSLKNK